MSILKELVFTPKCLGCKRLGVAYCNTCIEKIQPFRARDLLELDSCFCASEYSGWIRDSIIRYKNGDAKYAEPLSKLLRKTLEELDVSGNMIVVPIPSSQLKIRERGFNTIANLCTHLTHECDSLKLDTSNLFLRRPVIDQVGLSAAQRLANLDGVFGVHRVINGTVVIVDDVVTTGATLNSAARILRYAGAQRVFGLALCGTPKTR